MNWAEVISRGRLRISKLDLAFHQLFESSSFEVAHFSLPFSWSFEKPLMAEKNRFTNFINLKRASIYQNEEAFMPRSFISVRVFDFACEKDFTDLIA